MRNTFQHATGVFWYIFSLGNSRFVSHSSHRRNSLDNKYATSVVANNVEIRCNNSPRRTVAAISHRFEIADSRRSLRTCRLNMTVSRPCDKYRRPSDAIEAKDKFQCLSIAWLEHTPFCPEPCDRAVLCRFLFLSPCSHNTVYVFKIIVVLATRREIIYES